MLPVLAVLTCTEEWKCSVRQPPPCTKTPSSPSIGATHENNRAIPVMLAAKQSEVGSAWLERQGSMRAVGPAAAFQPAAVPTSPLLGWNCKSSGQHRKIVSQQIELLETGFSHRVSNTHHTSTSSPHLPNASHSPPSPPPPTLQTPSPRPPDPPPSTPDSS